MTVKIDKNNQSIRATDQMAETITTLMVKNSLYGMVMLLIDKMLYQQSYAQMRVFLDRCAACIHGTDLLILCKEYMDIVGVTPEEAQNVGL